MGFCGARVHNNQTIQMVSERRCVELRVGDLDDKEIIRLRELETKVLSLSDLLEFQLKRMKREVIQERVR